jgi:CheY-like chemotaxis protein
MLHDHGTKRTHNFPFDNKAEQAHKRILIPLAALIAVCMGRSPKQTFAVLLADDSDQDRLLMRLALQGHPSLPVVAEVEDGAEVMAYLSGHGKYRDRKKHPFPDLLILDLKMPRRTGYEILQWLQVQSFNDLRVVVVSGSVLPEDYSQSIKLGADAFYVKAGDRQQREAMVRGIVNLMKKSRRRKVTRA